MFSKAVFSTQYTISITLQAVVLIVIPVVLYLNEQREADIDRSMARVALLGT